MGGAGSHAILGPPRSLARSQLRGNDESGLRKGPSRPGVGLPVVGTPQRSNPSPRRRAASCAAIVRTALGAIHAIRQAQPRRISGRCRVLLLRLPPPPDCVVIVSAIPISRALLEQEKQLADLLAAISANLKEVKGSRSLWRAPEPVPAGTNHSRGCFDSGEWFSGPGPEAGPGGLAADSVARDAFQ